MIDLHTHSIHSDGTETPTELVQRARDTRLTAFAIADHDTVAGQEEALAAGKKTGVRMISAIEMTVDFHGGHIHVLGYGFDLHDAHLSAALGKRAEERRIQFYEKVSLANDRLRAAGKGTLDADALLDSIQGSPGRPHIARAIVERGWEPTFRKAFDAYLLDYAPTSPALSPSEAIGLIHRAGGFTSLAHPGSDEIGLRRCAKNKTEEREAFAELIASGLDAVEAYTPAHSQLLINNYLSLAKDFNLLITGGTDWHGPSFDAPAPGEFEIPDSILDHVLQAINKG